MSDLPQPDPETVDDATAPHPMAEGADLEDATGSAAFVVEDHDDQHPEADHQHDPDHEEGHPQESAAWVLIPLAIGAVVGLILVVILGLGTS